MLYFGLHSYLLLLASMVRGLHAFGLRYVAKYLTVPTILALYCCWTYCSGGYVRGYPWMGWLASHCRHWRCARLQLSHSLVDPWHYRCSERMLSLPVFRTAALWLVRSSLPSAWWFLSGAGTYEPLLRCPCPRVTAHYGNPHAGPLLVHPQTGNLGATLVLIAKRSGPFNGT